MKHKNVPVFIPHLGCPNDCVFCNQHKITDTSFDEGAVPDIINEALSTVGKDDEAEIAFFGGSFTGIDRALMIRLLEVGYGYIKTGRVSSLRCSTRPDYIDGEIIEILKKYGVKTVELGIQSTDDAVLKLCKRGHTADQSLDAMKALKDARFTVIGQMMTGLPGADGEPEIKTAEDICKYCDGGRIYPTVVFRGTELAEMAERNEYAPLSIKELIERTADVKEVFIKNNKPTIRIGLQANEGLTSAAEIACGGYDEAIGEKCEGEIYYRRLEKLLSDKSGAVKVKVPRGCVSKACGHKKANKKRLMEKFGLENIIFIEGDIPEYTVSMAE